MSNDRSEASWASAITDLPNEDATKYGNEACEDLEEGVGDNDEVLRAAIGVSDEFHRISFNLSHRTTSGGKSLGIRKKMGDGMKKRKKLSPSQKIVDALKKIVDAYRMKVGRAHADEMPITKIMKDLEQYEEITSTNDWYRRCRSLLMDRNAREMYAVLKGRKKQLLIWLKHCLVTEVRCCASETSIPEVMKDLKQHEEITSDGKWFGRCCSLLKDPSARKRYVELKGQKKQLLIWLRHECFKN